ncbi:Putative amino-acid ABC transporter-binding protein YhdW [Alphaproteobacteria bacterium SO-S41]|nr:Putative amino-acid ABC transporter-binding protein YhdW [Alphaproteobacteria bacterium SO-S41]
MKTAIIAVTLTAAAALGGVAAAESATLKEVKARGYLKCGVSDGLTGFSNPDSQGNWSGIDVDVCRAVAAAIFDDPNAVRYTSTTAKERFTALTKGEFDILSRNTTITMQRDAGLGMEFTGVTYYDGQGFIVKTDSGVASVNDLNGATVCTQTGTTTELNVADYFGAHGMTYQILAFEKESEALSAYDSGRCDTYTTDQSGLFAAKLELADANAHTILPEIISKEPLGPAVRQGDDAWEDLVRWTFYAMVNAEEMGVTSQNVDEMLKSPSPEIRRLLGVEGDFGTQIGLTNDWAVRVIRKVGNYGEIFERNVGMGSQLKIPRGKNALWNQGGLQYAPPIH